MEGQGRGDGDRKHLSPHNDILHSLYSSMLHRFRLIFDLPDTGPLQISKKMLYQQLAINENYVLINFFHD